MFLIVLSSYVVLYHTTGQINLLIIWYTRGEASDVFNYETRGGFHKGSPNLGLVLGNAKR